MKKTFLFLFLFLFLFSCSKKENKEIEYNTISDTVQLQKNILEKGDVNSFLSLMMAYDTPKDSLSYKILKYSYIMADQYNYNRANYFIARSILRKEMITNNYTAIKDLDEENKKIVLERLNKCSDQNVIICTEILIEYYKSINNISEVEKFKKKLNLLIN